MPSTQLDMDPSLKEQFFYLCNLFGSCSQRTQGTGGNISVKDATNLIVKASGYRLSSVNNNDGYVICSIQKIQEALDEGKEQLEGSILEGAPRKPSMEAYFHILPKTIIVHFHSVYFCKYLCKQNAADIFSIENFPNSKFISYKKPGLDLAKELVPLYRNESILFLENHGIILLGESIEEIITVYLDATQKLETLTQTICSDSDVSIEKRIKDRTNQTIKPIYNLASSLSQPFKAVTPDHFLFLQQTSLISTKATVENDLSEWKSMFHSFPSILQVDETIYSLAQTYEQCQNKEEYLRSYFDIYGEAQEISPQELTNLIHCPKEQFRLSKK